MDDGKNTSVNRELKQESGYTRQIARPAVFWIVFGVLKGYVRNPLTVLIQAAAGLGALKKQFQGEYPKEFLVSAGFLYALYQALKKRHSEHLAFEICRIAALSSGIAVQMAHFGSVEIGRSFENLLKEHQQTIKTGSTSLNQTEILEVNSECVTNGEKKRLYHFRVTRCAFYDFFNCLGVPRLTTLFCAVDNAVFNAYLPEELFFSRMGKSETIPKGAEQCTFLIEGDRI